MKVGLHDSQALAQRHPWQLVSSTMRLYTGVYNPIGNRVTVENGEIIGFDWGITYDGTSGGTISNVTSDHNLSDEVILRNSRNGLITGVHANRNGGDGIDMSNNHHVNLH